MPTHWEAALLPLHCEKLSNVTWLRVGSEEALIAADPAANSVCSAADPSLACRGSERSSACRGEVPGTGRKAVKMEVGVHECDCYHSARAGGVWATGRGQGGHGSGYVPAGCTEDADNG